MSFEKGKSKITGSNKMQELIKSGRPQRQAVAIALAQARRIHSKLPKPARKARLPRKKHR